MVAYLNEKCNIEVIMISKKYNITCPIINKLIALGWAEWNYSYGDPVLRVHDGRGLTWEVLRKEDRGVAAGEWKYFSNRKQWLPMNSSNNKHLIEAILYYKQLSY